MATTILAERARAAMTRIQDAALAAATAAWRALPDYNEADVAQFIDVAGPIYEAAQAQATILADGYVSLAVSGLTGQTFAPIGVATISNPVTRLREPFTRTWHDLANGQPWQQAVTSGQNALAEIIMGDVQASFQGGAVDAMKQHQSITHYVRVTEPDCCGFCAVAATKVYLTSQLQPLHAFCRCGVEPRDGAVPSIADHGLLAQLKQFNEPGKPYYDRTDLRLTDGVVGIRPDHKAWAQR